MGHGHAKHNDASPTYNSWCAMVQRCTNPNTENWCRYGGRGIKVCDRWLKSFENFLVDMGARPEDQTLDRMDPDKGYDLSNCRWATMRQQGETKRQAVLISYGGETRTLSGWAKHLGINKQTIFLRHRKGWSVDRLLTKRDHRCR